MAKHATLANYLDKKSASSSSVTTEHMGMALYEKIYQSTRVWAHAKA